MKPSPEFQRKLKASETEIRNYISYLQAENAKLQKRVAQLAVACISKDHRIASLDKELKKQIKKGHLTVIVNRSVGEKT